MRLLVGALMLSLVALTGFGLAACGGVGSDETALGEDEARQLILSLIVDPAPSSAMCRPLAGLSIEDATALIEDVGGEAFIEAFNRAFSETFEEAIGEAPDIRQCGEIIAEECDRRRLDY